MIAISSRPIHKKYALCSVSDSTYISFVNGYSVAKKCGIKGVWLYIGGSGVASLCLSAFKNEVKSYGKRKIAAGTVSALTWIGTPLVPLITNSTKLIKIANATHTCITFIAETCEDCTNVAWLPIDMILVGQPISMGASGRYNLMGGDHSIIPFLGDE